MGTCSKKKAQHRKRNRDEIEYGSFQEMQRSVWQKMGHVGSGGR